MGMWRLREAKILGNKSNSVKWLTMFPLPIPHEKRTSPLDFIPSCDDVTGQGARMWRILSLLKITQGKLSGKTLGEVAPPWQEKWIRTLYGTVKEDGKTRLYDEAFLKIAKKQGKSTFSGMVAIAHTMAFPEPRGLGIILADSKEQAGIVYDSLASTIEADPYLREKFHVRRYRNDVIHRETQTILKAVATEYAATVGQIPSFYIVDELHLLGLKSKGTQLVKQLSSGLAVRENPLGIYITTAPVGVASGIYTSTYNRAKRILAGEAPEERMLPVLFDIPDGADPDDPQWWWMANPSMDYTITREWFEREYKLAKTDPDPAIYANFLSQHLNVHAQEVVGIDRWIPLDIWDRYMDPDVTLDFILENCTSIYLGIDAGYRRDASAVLVYGVVDEDQHFVWCRQWMHADAFNIYKDFLHVQDYVDNGELIVGETENADVIGMLELINLIYDTGKLVAVGVDPAKLQTIVRKMEEKGIIVVAIPQGWQLNPHIIETERLLYSGTFHHGDCPMLRWNVENGKLAERGQAKALVKPLDVSGSGDPRKIDGLVCLVMAVALVTNPEYQTGLTGAGELMVM